ncbi:MAG: aminotransferase class I/II-fold pyridoxal phosphate-dependent enzyme [Promethearchaeota archaeon]
MSESPQLDHLRSEIERVTLSIIDLVGKRNTLVHDVAKEKFRISSPLVNPSVERQLRAAVSDRCRLSGVDPEFGQRLLNQLMEESIRLQREALPAESVYDGHALFTRAKDMESSGKRVIHLEVGEPDFGPPTEVVQAMNSAVANRMTRYTQSTGILALREKIADIHSYTSNREISPQDVIITVSGKYALFLGVASCLQAGDEAIIIDPSFPAYSSCVRAVGGRPVHVPTELERDWILDVDIVREHINESTKLIVLNSPSNPTGTIMDERTCKALIDLAVENDIRILSDEAYSVFSYTPHTSILDFQSCDQTIVKSFSKPYGMTGFRLGYAISDNETIKKMARLQYLHLTCVPEFIQHAGIAALDCDEHVKRNSETIRSRLQLVSRLLSELPVSFRPAEGGFYIFAKLNSDKRNGVEFAERLLSEKGVCVMPGIIYGGQYSPFFRTSVCQPEDQLEEGLKLMAEVIG